MDELAPDALFPPSLFPSTHRLPSVLTLPALCTARIAGDRRQQRPTGSTCEEVTIGRRRGRRRGCHRARPWMRPGWPRRTATPSPPGELPIAPVVLLFFPSVLSEGRRRPRSDRAWQLATLAHAHRGPAAGPHLLFPSIFPFLSSSTWNSLLGQPTFQIRTAHCFPAQEIHWKF
jgi:hypothetical protein